MKQQFAIFLPALIVLVGCQTVRDIVEDPVVVQGDMYGVTYRFSEGMSDDARRAAEKHCGRYDRKIQLDRIVPGEGNNRSAIYRCI